MSEVIERPKRTSELVVERMERLIRDGVALGAFRQT